MMLGKQNTRHCEARSNNCDPTITLFSVLNKFPELTFQTYQLKSVWLWGHGQTSVVVVFKLLEHSTTDKKHCQASFIAKKWIILYYRKTMIYIDFITIGDLPNGGFDEIRDKFLKHLKTYTKLEHRILKSADDLHSKIIIDNYLIILDEFGQTMNSRTFASKLKILEESGKHITVVLGGAKGLPEEIKKKADLRLSLSPMTTTHDLAHIFFLEQLYRACTINHGKEYHY
jgi:23S rRNA (pseudouridine1915-N3)-methyltransferase